VKGPKVPVNSLSTLLVEQVCSKLGLKKWRSHCIDSENDTNGKKESGKGRKRRL